MGAFNRDPKDLVVTTSDKLVVNLHHPDFLSDTELQSLLEDLNMVPIADKVPIFNEDPLVVGPFPLPGLTHLLHTDHEWGDGAWPSSSLPPLPPPHPPFSPPLPTLPLDPHKVVFVPVPFSVCAVTNSNIASTSSGCS